MSAAVTVGVSGGGVIGGEMRGSGTDPYVDGTEIIANESDDRETKTKKRRERLAK